MTAPDNKSPDNKSPDNERLEASDLALLRRMWPYARPDRGPLTLAFLLTPVIAALNLAQPWLLGRVIDEHVVTGQLAGLRDLALLYLGAIIAAYFIEAVYTLSLSWTGQRTILRLRQALYAHTLTLPQSFTDQQPAGKLLTRVTSDVESLGDSLTAGVITIALDLLMIAGVLGAMLWLDWRLTCVLLLLTPPLLAVVEALRRQLRKLYLEIREALASVNAYMAEHVDGVQVVQLFGVAEERQAAFAERNDRFRRASKTSNVYDASMYSVVDGASSIFIAVMLAYAAGLALPLLAPLGISAEPVSVGILVAFMDYLARLFRPLRELSGKVSVIQRAIAALSKIFWLFETPQSPPDGAETMGELRGHVALRGVRFRYRDGLPEVLRGVDLEVSPGTVVAVVGASGSGKTTLTRLLDRSYEGYSGSITIDGVELSTLSRSSLRSRIATVRQDIQVFSEPLRFNVTLDSPRIDTETAARSASLVHADHFVERLGWDHVLRERGADLSVGEGQLLTFARTMAHDPDMIILDEATASVDSLTEGLVQDAIAQILARKTVIVIAHRLSTIQHADRIAVMDKGVVVEQGTHAELMAAGGAYAALVAAGQAQAGRPTLDSG